MWRFRLAFCWALALLTSLTTGAGAAQEAETSEAEPCPGGEAPEGSEEAEGEPQAIEAETAGGEHPGEGDASNEGEAESSSDGETPEAESPEGEIEGETKPGKFLNCGGRPDAPATSILGDALVVCLAAMWMRTYRRRAAAK